MLQVERGVGRLLRRRQAGQQLLGRGQRQLGVDRVVLALGLQRLDAAPGISVRNTSLSACSAMATLVATSSIVRLKASPVGEKPNGDSSTMAPKSSVRVMPATSTLRTRPGVLEVDAVEDADRPRRDEVAGDHAHRGAGHRRVRQALAEGGLDLVAQLAGGFLRESSATSSVMRMPCE
jgi:hypothetical protein